MEKNIEIITIDNLKEIISNLFLGKKDKEKIEIKIRKLENDLNVNPGNKKGTNGKPIQKISKKIKNILKTSLLGNSIFLYKIRYMIGYKENK
jgi:hypothetical protein